VSPALDDCLSTDGGGLQTACRRRKRHDDDDDDDEADAPKKDPNEKSEARIIFDGFQPADPSGQWTTPHFLYWKANLISCLQIL
jgi:hypothetical protein